MDTLQITVSQTFHAQIGGHVFRNEQPFLDSKALLWAVEHFLAGEQVAPAKSVEIITAFCLAINFIYDNYSLGYYADVVTILKDYALNLSFDKDKPLNKTEFIQELAVNFGLNFDIIKDTGMEIRSLAPKDFIPSIPNHRRDVKAFFVLLGEI